ncbi:MAG: hypothetical protein GX638_19545, partial [Crenarchaeota archaeon]|nr:hypothetical protein [Thermoproteota archaeon]
MGTQVVKHTSRDYDVILNFASTENNLSWSFTQEGDGDIYDIELVNVASYTIAGGAVTLPYTVKNNTKYSVSIVKTTQGQTASITLKTRRQEQKIITQIVPDFGSNIATHLFAISNTSLYKLDKTLLNQGLNPIIATIPLPIVDSALTIYWQQCVWVNEGGIEGRIYCFGQSVNTLGVSLRYNYSLYVDVATLTVYSYSDVVNSFTKHENQWNTGRAISTLYDPDEKWVARVSNGIQTDGYYLEYISTNTISAKKNSRKFSSLTNVCGSDATQNVYDYENKVFWRGHGYNFITQLPNILGYFNLQTLWTFIHRNSGTIKAISPDGNLSGRMYSISRDGETIGFTIPSPAVIP